MGARRQGCAAQQRRGAFPGNRPASVELAFSSLAMTGRCRHRGIPEVELHLAGDLTGHAVEHQLFRPVCPPVSPGGAHRTVTTAEYRSPSATIRATRQPAPRACVRTGGCAGPAGDRAGRRPPGRGAGDQPESPATPHGREPAGTGRGEAGELGRGRPPAAGIAEPAAEAAETADSRQGPTGEAERRNRANWRISQDGAPIGVVSRKAAAELMVKASRRFDAAGGGHQDRSGLSVPAVERGHVIVAADACRVRDEPAEVKRRVVKTCRGRPSADSG